MNMKRLLTLVAFFATLKASAQQVNPVPDYVFRNQMSVGRNAVTDTAAYFSIGPRYGATKGFMPPIVGDTATFSSGKRNGLLIFSVQKNKFLYWDSVRVQWSDMAGSSGAYIVAGDTASMLAPYLRKADTTAMLSPYYRSATASAALALKLNISDTSSMLGNYIRHAGYGLTKSGQSFLVDTLNIATRAWRQKGLDSLAALEVSGSGTTNYVAKFTAGSTIGNSQIFDDGTSVGVGTTSPNIYSSGAFKYLTVSNNAGGGYSLFTVAGGAGGGGEIDFGNQTIRHAAIASLDGSNFGIYTNNTNSGTGVTERLRVFANGRIGVNTTTDAGYQFDINGTLRTVNGANFATSSGNVGVGALADASDYRLQVKGPAAIGNGVTDNQVLIGFQQDLKFRYRQNISSAYGFVFDSANLESLVLTSFEGGNQQAFLLMGDGTSGNIFGFSHSVNSGSTFTADFVIDYNGIIGINTNQPNASAQLDVSSTTRGFLPPRMTTAQRDAISSPAAGLIIYNTSTSKLQVYTTSWTDLH